MLAPFLFVICLDYILRISVDSERTKSPMRTMPTTLFSLETIADNASTLLHPAENAARMVGLYVNTREMEFMCHTK